MSNSLHYPFQRGTESLPTNPDQRFQLRYVGYRETENTETLHDWQQRNSGLIEQFISTQRRLHDLSGLTQYRGNANSPEFTGNFTYILGSELVTITPRLREFKKAKKSEEIITYDIMKDGYIGILTVNPLSPPPRAVREVGNKVKFNTVWVYVPGYDPPGGYEFNGGPYQVLPSPDGYTYGIMRFDAWYRLLDHVFPPNPPPDPPFGEAQLSWAAYENGELKWVGPEEKRVVYKYVYNKRVSASNPYDRYIISQALDAPDLGITIYSFYKTETDFESYYGHGPDPRNMHSFTIKLNGQILYEYIGEPNTSECLIFRFGPKALRSHSYRDDLTEQYLQENNLPGLLNKIIPARPDPADKLTNLLPANCGLDPGFWKGTCQLYDNLYTNSYVPITIRDMGEFDVSLINDEENIIEIEWPTELTIYNFDKFLLSPAYFPYSRNVSNVTGTVTAFAEFYSRASDSTRLVDQSWHYGYTPGQKIIVNDKPMYFFPDPIQVSNFAAGSQVIDGARLDNVFDSSINALAPTVSNLASHVADKGYIFRAKTPNVRMGDLGTAVEPKLGTPSEITPLKFKFNLSSSEKTQPVTPIDIEYNPEPPPNNIIISASSIRTTTLVEFWQGHPSEFAPNPLVESIYGSFWLDDIYLYNPHFINGVANTALYQFQKEYYDATESENGVQDWLLFVRSLYCSYQLGSGMVSETVHITNPQEEEKWVK